MAVFADKQSILEAARLWSDVLLGRKETLLSSQPIWSVEGVQELRRRFVEQPMEGEQTFFQKLEEQLKGAPGPVIQLMAEILWGLYLFPTNVGPKKKRENITRVWLLSHSPLPANSRLLSDEVLQGIGSGGPGFNNHMWREVSMAIQLFSDLLMLPPAKREPLLSDGIAMAAWIDAKAYSENRQFRHIILHLFFPEQFERISSGRNKRAILNGFGVANWRDEAPGDERLAADLALFKLRQSLGGSSVDFYQEPFVATWRSTSQPSETDLDGKSATKGGASGEASEPHIHQPLNHIFYGPPGTGKTYQLEGGQLARFSEYMNTTPDGEPCLEMVTFHQSYGYEDFIEGLSAELHDGGIAYRPKQGVFLKLCRRAEKHPDQRFAIFIDEINRGNISKVFGELITLIEPEKRQRFLANGEPDTERPGTQVRLPYSGERFGVPVNLDIIATMNTADRSLTRLDTALRRRFEFIELMPRPDLLEGLQVEGVDVARLLRTMNRRIEVLYDRDHMLGHAFFIPLIRKVGALSVADDLAPIFERKILPLLEEYFFEDWEHIRMVLGDNQKEHAPALQFIRRRPDGDIEALFGNQHDLVDRRQDKEGRFERNAAAFVDARAYRGIYEASTGDQ